MRQFVVMGVSGCGKSTVAKLLAEKTGGLFFDADDFHPPANKAKMAAGIPLTDEDRQPWLAAMNRLLKEHAAEPGYLFLACSALRQIYRDWLGEGLPGLRFIYLKGSREVIGRRLQARKGHFMPAALLESQFATLEEPRDAIVAPIDCPPPEMAERILAQIGPQG